MQPSDSHTDFSTLTEGIAKGSMVAFEQLYWHLHRDLYRFALHVVKSEALAQDIVQEVFTRLWENRHKLQKEQSIKSYLFTICRNLALNLLQKAATEQQLYQEIVRASAASFSPDDDLSPTQEAMAQEALLQLPPVRRQVFEMAKVQGLSYQQIAEQLHISTGTVSDHMVKANRFLRDYVKNKPISLLLLVVSVICLNFFAAQA